MRKIARGALAFGGRQGAQLSVVFVDGRTLVVHAVVWDRLAPHGMATLAAALADALTPIARRLGQAQLARMAP